MRKRKSRRTGKVMRGATSVLSRENKQLAAKTGLPPGSLVYVGNKVTDRLSISLIRYDSTQVQAVEDVSLQHLHQVGESTGTTWIVV